MDTVWMPEHELKQHFDGIVSATFDDVYLNMAGKDEPSVLAVGGRLGTDPKDFERKVLEAWFKLGNFESGALRFCEAYDLVREVQVAPGKKIPLIYVVSFVHDTPDASHNVADRRFFLGIENLVPELNEWVIFNLAVSKDGYSSQIGRIPYSRYREAVVRYR